MKNINKKTILKYLYNQLTGNFIGFLIGVSATGLISQFFETRSLKNFWGLTAKKTIVDKETFHELEWVISIVIGFIAFEIVTKVLKEKLERNFPKYKMVVYRWIIRKELHYKFRSVSEKVTVQRIVIFAAVHQGVKQAFNRYSSRN